MIKAAFQSCCKLSSLFAYSFKKQVVELVLHQRLNSLICSVHMLN